MTTQKQDTITSANKQREYYSDFMDSFAFTPFGNELARITNARDVGQSIKNLIRTSINERLFQPNVGCNISKLNFELNDNITDLGVVQYVTNTITTYEPRCNLLSVTALSSPDNQYINITITFSLINSTEPTTISLSLKRVR